MKNLIFILVILAALAAAPNLLWLRHSTVQVTNEGNVRLYNVALRIGTQSSPIGNVQPESTRFDFLPTGFGEASLSVEHEVNYRLISHCQEYVESTGYHVEVVVDKDQQFRCTTELPISSSLLVQKLF